MMGPTHRLGAAATWLGGCLLLHPSPVATFGGASLAAIAAPQCDLDSLGTWSRTKRRWSKKRNPVRYRLSKLGMKFRATPVKYRIALFLSVFGRHRLGPSHSFIVAALVGAALMAPRLWLPAWPLWVGPAVTVGMWSHITLDLLNVGRVRPMWPWGLPWEGLGVHVGKAMEVLVIRTALGLACLGFAWLIVRGP